MSINRKSDLNTSRYRTEGTHTTYLNLSSVDRDKSVDPSSSDALLTFEEQSNVTSMEIKNFEIPHTRYAINKTNNNLYISEKWGEDLYYFYSLRASTGGYSISNLAVSLELSTQCPVIFNGDKSMGNTYTFTTADVFGKVGMVSSGDYPYSIHNANETVTLTSMVKSSDTEATVTFLSSSEYIFQAGALLLLKPHTYYDREVQIVEMVSGRSARLIGDFSDIDEATLNIDNTTMVPYSAENSVSKIMGMGDLDLTGHTSLEVLAIASPFATSSVLDDVSVMAVVNFPIFVSAGDFVRLEGSNSFMNDTIFEVAEVHDDTHLELSVDRSSLLSNTDGKISIASDPSTFYTITSTSVLSVDNNDIDVVLGVDPSAFNVGDSISFTGFDNDEMKEVSAEVLSIDTLSISVRLTYPTKYLSMDDDEDVYTTLTPVNQDTGIATTYLTPYRFDLSRGRRMVLCRAIIDNQDVGSIHIPALTSSNFFGRIQLFSGADLVNFLNSETAVGFHEFNSVVKRLNRIRFKFFNEDGTEYDFVGVDYTIFLKITSLDSNTGI